jgi:hypothetical protein
MSGLLIGIAVPVALALIVFLHAARTVIKLLVALPEWLVLA